jgi:UDP-N-acetylenolpyruvoylglucosamine reductase
LLRRDEPLSKRTTMRVGGPVDLYVEPQSETDLGLVLEYCHAHSLPWFLLGRGSNLLIRDGGVRGVAIALAHAAFSQIEIRDGLVHCGAGARLKLISQAARRAGIGGLEFLEGIPGTLGGALRMNAGAMGGWTFNAVETVRFMCPDGTVSELPASQIPSEYRSCPLFKTHIALGAVLHGQNTDPEAIREMLDQYNRKRWETQPPQPSAGCTFKNPSPTLPAGRLIDELGLKGFRCGNAMVSDVHANFIVNLGGATAGDVLQLIDEIRERARVQRDIDLHVEVEILGEN